MKYVLFILSCAVGLNTTSFAQTATELYAEGVKLKDEKRSGAALLKFKNAIELKPDYVDAKYEMGWCMNDTKDYTGAIKALREVRPVWSGIAKVHYELGYAFEKNNMYDSAKASYYKTLEIAPKYTGAHRQLGYIEYYAENYLTALSHFNMYEEVITTEIKDYLYWYRKGFMENAQKNYSAAKTALNKSKEYKQDYLNTWLELGFACKNLKEDDQAIDYYKKAMELDPKSHIPYNGIGEVYRDNKRDMNEAMNWYRKTLDVKAKERKACYGLGYCLNSLMRYSEAIPYLRTAIEQENTYTAAFTELGYAYYKTANYPDALTNLNKSISLNPNGINPLYYLTLVHIAQKNKTKAQETVDKLRNLKSKYADELQAKVNAL